MLRSLSIPQTREPSIDTIIGAVSMLTGISAGDITGRRRSHAVAHARQIAMKLARQLTSQSLTEIAEKFGNRDHGTVIHACKVIAEKSARDAHLREVLETCITRTRARPSTLANLPPMPV
ncbi:MAG: hypothetical protein MUF31_15465 [Akkermansiaceae bacterium]|jgi:chromosomal replication initiator protein|nr:hypothetical protein [Akkermansiaceae bacterium]